MPDINNLIQISDIFNISLDILLKDNNCVNNLNNNYNYKANEVFLKIELCIIVMYLR